MRGFNWAIRMVLSGEQSQEMCGSNGAAATRLKEFCDAFPYVRAPAGVVGWLEERRVYL